MTNSKLDYLKFQHAHHKVSTCFNCETSTDILHDDDHDIIYCQNCGTVLREGFNDYNALELANFPVMSRENKLRNIKKE